jgi:hypothetical protein
LLAFGRWVDTEMSCLQCQCRPEEEPDAAIGTEWRILRHTAAFLIRRSSRRGCVPLAVVHTVATGSCEDPEVAFSRSAQAAQWTQSQRQAGELDRCCSEFH